MNIEMVNLVLLQKLDAKIALIKSVQDTGPTRIAEVENELAEAEAKVNQALELEQEMKKRRRTLETEIEDNDQKVQANQKRQLQVKTNEEYRALLKENDFLKKSNSTREDEVLELMEKLEALVQENKNLKTWLEEQRQLAAARREEIELEVEASRKDQETLDVERRNLVRDLPDIWMAHYNRIYGHRNGKAVVGIVDGVCTECHLQMPPQEFNELQRNDKLMFCPNCLRIVYWKDHQDFEDL